MKELCLIIIMFAATVFGAVQAQANTYGQPYEIYPHGGTMINAHEVISPGNAVNAAAKANQHMVVTTLPKTGENCTAGQPWTYYTWDLVPRRQLSTVWTGKVRFWRQDC